MIRTDYCDELAIEFMSLNRAEIADRLREELGVRRIPGTRSYLSTLKHVKKEK